MSKPKRVRLFCDHSSEMPFEGSCALVAYWIRECFERRGVPVEEVVFDLPLFGEAGEPVDIPRADDALDIFFEEIYTRARFEVPDDRYQAFVYFNLLCFNETSVAHFLDARLLLFNSDTLRDHFDSAVLQARAKGLLGERPCEVASATCALPVPTDAFPEGYPSVGETLAEECIDALTRDHVVGHALRPGKNDPVALVALAHALAEHRIDGRSFRILVSEAEWPKLVSVGKHMGLPTLEEEVFVVVPWIDNRSLVQVFRRGHFGLAYDINCIEAFGFYVAESVACGCPVFSNGAGNLRQLVPPGHGIEVFEEWAMTHGSPDEALAAHAKLADRIVAALQEPETTAACQRGGQWLRRHHSVAGFQSQLFALTLGEPPPERKTLAEDPRARLHPAVRAWDPASGRVSSDLGATQLDEQVNAYLSARLAGESTIRPEYEQRLVDGYLLNSRPLQPSRSSAEFLP